MLGMGWLPHWPFDAFDDILTPVFDRTLLIVIPFHILESVQFPLPENLIICHTNRKLPVAMPEVETSGMQSGVFFLQHAVIVLLHALLPGPKRDILVLFTWRKQAVGIVLFLRLRVTLCIVFSWCSIEIVLQSDGTEVCFHPRWRKRRWLRLGVCHLSNILKLGKHVEVFPGIFVSIELMIWSVFNVLGCTANSYILLAWTFKCSGWCNLKWLTHQLSAVNLFGHENLGQYITVFSGIVNDTRGVEYTL